MESKSKKITTFSLVMMIITAIFGFGNVSNAYEQMGYGSIIWYILAGVCFFFPAGLMMAEYGSAFKDAKGGIYTWLAGSVGEKTAFIGTFIWLSSWIVWMVSTSSRIWVTFSALIFGKDTTQQWGVLGLSSTQVIGLLGILFILVSTFVTTKGMDSIAKVGALGGMFTIVTNLIFIVASLIIIIVNKGHLAQPIHGVSDFLTSPNPDFKTPIAIISFIVYAIFAYSGMESLGSVTDSMDNPTKTFPRGLIIASLFTIGAYVTMIFMIGFSVNYDTVVSQKAVNLGNITYVIFNQLGLYLGQTLGWSHQASVMAGLLITRFVALTQFLGFIGAFFILIYSPIKSFILGSDERLWPKKLTQLNQAGMPANAMWIQAIIVSVIVFAVAFGGSASQRFFQILTDMSNVSATLPYVFIIGAFPFFKQKDLERPFEVFKNKFWTNALVIFIEILVTGGVIFTCIQPILEHDYETAFWTIAGPVFFAVIALVFYNISAKKHHVK